jgi:predicted O-linked N-acetylglucosamine transferase (SPINDLY family)
LAWRPVPVSAGYLGYAGTTGADYIDYIIADAIAIPPENDAFFSEKVVRLPHCFFPSDTVGRGSGPVPSRAAEGLPESAFVFCSFNNSYKITPPLFDIWMRLLHTVASSVLWLRVENPGARISLAQEAAKRGIDASRLIFSERAPREAHIVRLALADLFLDSTPYNAHTTCNDALAAGLPVLTVIGKSFGARVAASMLTASGLTELIAPDLAAYEALAVELAHHPERLAAMRQHLARTRGENPLFDIAGLTRALERAYVTMFERAAAGLPPESFAVEAGG